DRLARAFGAAQLHHGAKTLDRAGPQVVRGARTDQLAALVIVGVGQERLDRDLGELRIAVELLAVRIGELGALDHGVNEIRPDDVKAVEVEAFEQGELLQHHRALAPDAGLAHRVAAVVVGERRLEGRLPARHVVAGEQAAVALAARVHDLLGAAEAVDRLGDEPLRPGPARLLDLRDAITAGGLGLFHASAAAVGYV